MSIFFELQFGKTSPVTTAWGDTLAFDPGTPVHRELEAFIYLLAEDYSIQYSNQYFNSEFGCPDGSTRCYELMRGRTQPCNPCPAQQVFSEREERVWLWQDRKHGKTYQIHDYPYQVENDKIMVLGIGLMINRGQKKSKPSTQPLSYEDLLRICCHCKNINNEQGVWEKIEAYFSKKNNIQFSHGICPECLQEHYPLTAKQILK